MGFSNSTLTKRSLNTLLPKDKDKPCRLPGLIYTDFDILLTGKYGHLLADATTVRRIQGGLKILILWSVCVV